jgi:hypothetical protein
MTDRPHLQRVLTATALAGLCFIGVMLAGCSSPLLSPEEPRSQYDRYDAVRSQHASQYKEDEFGARKPNLRARLLPKE